MKKTVVIDGKHVFGESGFPLDVSTWIQHGDYPSHTHSFSEIAIILEGTGTTDVDGQLFHFHAGDVFVLHGTRPHAYLNTHDLTLINITYDPKVMALDRFNPGTMPGYQALFVIDPALRRKEPYKGHLTLTPDQTIKVKALTDIMERELHNRPTGFELIASGHFMILVALLSRFYTETETPDAQKVLRLAGALSFLEQHFMDPVDVEKLASIAHMSRRSFYRAFTEVTHQTPLAYLLRLRVMKAVEILNTTEKSVTEVAFECGFEDSNYFSRQFKKVLGIPPGEFQKKYNRAK